MFKYKKVRPTLVALVTENTLLREEVARLKKELSWTLVDSDNPVQLGDELLVSPKCVPNPWHPTVTAATIMDIHPSRHQATGTYRRPVNPPEEYGASDRALLAEIYPSQDDKIN